MKRKNLVDFITATLLILLGAITLIFPLIHFTKVKVVLIIIFLLYGILNLIQFILTYKDGDFEGLFTTIASVIALTLTLTLNLKIPLNIAVVIFVWVSLMSLIKLKKADYYHDRHKKIWILKIITLILFLIIGLLSVINLYYEDSVQVLVIGFFCFIHGVLELVDPITNYLVDKK